MKRLRYSSSSVDVWEHVPQLLVRRKQPNYTVDHKDPQEAAIVQVSSHLDPC